MEGPYDRLPGFLSSFAGPSARVGRVMQAAYSAAHLAIIPLLMSAATSAVLLLWMPAAAAWSFALEGGWPGFPDAPSGLFGVAVALASVSAVFWLSPHLIRALSAVHLQATVYRVALEAVQPSDVQAMVWAFSRDSSAARFEGASARAVVRAAALRIRSSVRGTARERFLVRANEASKAVWLSPVVSGWRADPDEFFRLVGALSWDDWDAVVLMYGRMPGPISELLDITDDLRAVLSELATPLSSDERAMVLRLCADWHAEAHKLILTVRAI